MLVFSQVIDESYSRIKKSLDFQVLLGSRIIINQTTIINERKDKRGNKVNSEFHGQSCPMKLKPAKREMNLPNNRRNMNPRRKIRRHR